MDGKGGCCIARYSDGGGSSGGGTYPTYDMSKIDRIMLKYRPIAPKPTTGGGSTSPRDVISTATTTTIKGGNKPTKSTGRGRRKSNGTTTKGAGANSGNSSGGSKKSNSTNNNNVRKRKSCSPEGWNSSNGCGGERLKTAIGQGNNNTSYDPIPPPIQKQLVTTLPLLPESPDLSFKKQKQTTNDRHPIWLNFGNPTATTVPQKSNTTPENYINSTPVYVQSPPPTVSSVITVECITDTWVNDCTDLTDEQKRMSLEKDTCPGFISDTWNRVYWTNQAYKKMIMGSSNQAEDTWKGEDQQGLCGVLMVMGEKVVVPLNYKAFTCKVKVQYYSSDVKKRVMVTTLPCDVWRLENGDGFVWRLDVKAALSLGL